MTLEEMITISAAVAIASGSIATVLATLFERRRVSRREEREERNAARNDEAEGARRLMTLADAEAHLRTWLVQENQKRDAENEKLRNDLRAVEQMLREETAARFDDRQEIAELKAIVERHEETIEQQHGEIEHLKTQFAEHKITPAPFRPRKI